MGRVTEASVCETVVTYHVHQGELVSRADGQTNRQTDEQTGTKAERQTIRAYRRADRQTNRLADTQTDRRSERDRRAERHMNRQS